jgi:ADP-ribosyl-[dinitrogen reductase] hydrolase
MTADRYCRTGTRAVRDRLVGILLGTAVGDALGLAAWAVEHQANQRPSIDGLGDLLIQSANNEPQWLTLVSEVQGACSAELTVSQFAAKMGLEDGVSGYVYHTVPVVTYAWWRHYGDFRSTVEAVLDCGGDTDTTGAITVTAREQARRS